jgi:hypothetical protein
VINRSAFLWLGQIPGSSTLGSNTGIFRGTAIVQTGFSNFTSCRIGTSQGKDGAVSGGTDSAPATTFCFIDVRNCSGKTIIKGHKVGDEVNDSIFCYNTAVGTTDSGVVANSGQALIIRRCLFSGNSGNLIPTTSQIFDIQNCWVEQGALTGIVNSGWIIGSTQAWDIGVAPDVCGAIPDMTPTRTQSPRPTHSLGPSPTSNFTAYMSQNTRGYLLFRFGAFTWFLEPHF